MKKFTTLITLLLLFASSLFAQSLTWVDVTRQFNMPEGIHLFQGERSSPPLKAWYLEVDLQQPHIAIRSYLSQAPGGKEGVAPFVQRVGAIAAVNGGYFDLNGSTSYSAVVYPGEVLAQNLSTIYRSGVPYPVTRSFFGMTTERALSVDWIYHFGSRVEDIYLFDQPTANAPGKPAPAPTKAQGRLYEKLLTGIGGGPTLIKNGAIFISHDEEVFWDSGIGYATENPRTAVGITPNNHAILLVVDGRQTASQGVTLPELAQMLLDLGCVEAMNLDGGGSTQMAVGNQLINRPEGGTYMRPVPSILAVVHADSLAFPKTIYYEKIIDTADPACDLVGLGWFASANAGYWGGTAAMLNTIGTGDRYAKFRLNVNAPAQYELFAWWVAASNRCKNTPFIVNHASGSDTVRLDQTINGSKWNRIGSYPLSGDSSEAIIISNAGTIGTYIVVDAVRVISYDPKTGSAIAPMRESSKPDNYLIANSYPNPFNSITTIRFWLAQTSSAKITVHNLHGELVQVLFNGEKQAGWHELVFDASNLSSGIYFARVRAGEIQSSLKMVLMK
ncbi:MAG: phosphodiester glycosidase family protein [candidate division KSB1 bacterium]|nr:phosphodiester glycosidase family protein [candidate division KSB1 bacterium]